MLDVVNTLDYIKSNMSIKLLPETLEVSPVSHTEKEVNMELIPHISRIYSMNQDTIIFKDDMVYVTPYVRKVAELLVKSGFRYHYFPVPFEHGNYPKNQETEWSQLVHNAELMREEEFTMDCNHYCDAHGIYPIQKWYLDNSMKIPENGIAVRTVFDEDMIHYPVIYNGYNWFAESVLGGFCYNNGVVLFVYRDGNSYLSKGKLILNELLEAGYTELQMFTPFLPLSNGEQIKDTELRIKWENIREY